VRAVTFQYWPVPSFRFAFYLSPLTSHLSLLTSHFSPLTSHLSLLLHPLDVHPADRGAQLDVELPIRLVIVG